MGNSSSSRGNGNPSFRRQTSMAEVEESAPFREEDQESLKNLYTSFTSAGGNGNGSGANGGRAKKHPTVDLPVFQDLLGIPELPWFAEALLAAMVAHRARAVGQDEGESTEGGSARTASTSQHLSLSEGGWYLGVAACCRDKRTTTLRVLFDMAGPTGEDRLDRGGLSRLFEAAYCCGLAAWGRSIDLRHFDASTLIGNLLSHCHRSGAHTHNSSSYSHASNGGTNGGKTAGAPAGALSEQEESVGFRDLSAWVVESVPLLHQTLSTFVQRKAFPPKEGAPPNPSLPVFNPPELSKPSFILDTVPGAMFGLSIASKDLQGPWMRLYTSEEDGMSFNRLAFNTIGFGGPSIVLVRDKKAKSPEGGEGTEGQQQQHQQHVFGGFADSPWKESNDFYGTSRGFLLQLAPNFKMMQSKTQASEEHFQWLNLKAYALPHGMGMGGTSDSFRFFIPESLEKEECVARGACMTFERGDLLTSHLKRYDIDCIEVWGVGGEEALRDAVEAQKTKRADTARAIQRARQVDKAKFAENEFDRENLLGKTFGGGAGGRDRGGR